MHITRYQVSQLFKFFLEKCPSCMYKIQRFSDLNCLPSGTVQSLRGLACSPVWVTDLYNCMGHVTYSPCRSITKQFTSLAVSRGEAPSARWSIGEVVFLQVPRINGPEINLYLCKCVCGICGNGMIVFTSISGILYQKSLAKWFTTKILYAFPELKKKIEPSHISLSIKSNRIKVFLVSK